MIAPINCTFTAGGGFAAWVPGTNITAYAYPGSPNADKARKSSRAQAKIARSMIENTVWILPTYVQICGYEALVETADRTYRAAGVIR